ncbi:MAG: hypothetical protein Q4F05_16430 [bacterium]|nr:hypothetical protein [bacterium]
MGKTKKIYRYFIMEAIGFYLIAFAAGTISSGVVNIFTHSEYILSLYSVFAILNLIVAIAVKGAIEKEYSSFCCIRKDIIRINLVSDLCIGMIEVALLALMIRFAHSFQQINASISLLDLEGTMGRLDIIQHIVFSFLMVMAIQAIVTFDFMCNTGLLKVFYGGKGVREGGNKVRSVLGFLTYMLMTILIGGVVAVFTQVEKQYIRTCLLAGLFVIAIVFYTLAAVKTKNKEFNVENE